VTTTGNTLSIQDNNALTSVAALASLTKLDTIDIGGNRMLTSLTGLGGVRDVGTLRIVSNQRLADLAALALTSVSTVDIRSNMVLQNIEGLAAITTVYDLEISDNAALRNVEGLRNLTSATNTLNIMGPINTLAGLRKLAIVNSLNIGSTRLTSLAGLGPFTFYSGGTLSIDSNMQLTTLADLAIANAPALSSLYITNNATLQDLTGLESVTAADRLTISMNNRLANLRGLSALEQLGNFDALNNPRLPACEIRALFMRANGQMLYELGNNNAAICQ